MSEDKISWYFTCSSVSSVKSCYTILNDGGHRSLFTKSIWKNVAPLKVKVFDWLACHDKIFSKVDLQKGNGLDWCLVISIIVLLNPLIIFCCIALLLDLFGISSYLESDWF